MIGVVLKGHDYKYEVSELIKLFTSDFRFIDERDCMMVIENSIFYHGDKVFSRTVYCENYEEILSNVDHRDLSGLDERARKKTIKETIKRSMFKILEQKFKSNVPWGILTGIRPVKIVHALLDEGKDEEYIKEKLKEDYYIKDDKIELALNIAKRERQFIYPIDEILQEEPKILEKSKRLMPRIYLDDIDVLIVNEIGKNISGTGVDTNIVGRFHTNAASGGPNTVKLGFLDISEKSGGNGNGMGLADFVSKKFFRKIDFESTYINAITSTEPNSVKLPLVLDNDKYVFQGCVKLCGVKNIQDIKLVIINNTKELDEIYMSKSAFENTVDKSKVKKESELFDIPFDDEGNLDLYR